MREIHGVGAAQPQPLQLRLTHSHGVRVEGVLELPAAGVGLAQAVALAGHPLNMAQWEDAEDCRIAWLGPEQGWQLTHGGRAVVCVLNGQRVAPRSSQPLAPGNVLEFGWQRFEVQAGGWARSGVGPLVGMEADSTARPASVALAASAPLEPAAFELRDLARWPDDAQGRGDRFSVLDIVGAERMPAADPLAELLGEAPRRRADLRTPEPPAQTRPAGVLEKLHEEFHRVVRDPAQLTGRADWNDAHALGFVNRSSNDDAAEVDAKYPLVRDVLQERETIDDTINGFHPLGTPVLMGVEAHEDVLRLFAPLQGNATPAQVPSLTRREHHALSPDSPMRLNVLQPEADLNALLLGDEGEDNETH